MTTPELLDVARGARSHEQLLEDIAGALRANRARGFLEGAGRIRQIAEALNDVVVLSDDATGEVLFVNVAYEKVWGRPRAELYANPLALLAGVHPSDRERIHNTLIGAQRRNVDIQYRIVRPSGEERWVWTRAFFVDNGDADGDRIASITVDVTERKQIAESHERLIRGFTHDIRNPLGAADGYLALFEAGALGAMSDVQARSIERARRLIHDALELVSGLLDIERAEAGELIIERRRVDLGVSMIEIVDEYQAAAAGRAIDLVGEVQSDAELLVVDSDGARIAQVTANLVSNAVKYTQPAGRISVIARAGLAAEGPWPGRWAAIVVTDTGPGIPLDRQPLVFREFTRFDPGAASGSGIGLAISRRLARALGGEITFTSTPGEGSTFTLWLPLEPRRAAPQ